MAAIRGEGKKYVYPQAVKPKVVVCDGSKMLAGSDRSWSEVCGNNDSSSLYALSPTAANAAVVFPKDFFLWTQRYVAMAQRNKPPTTASARAQVLWAVDVLAHVTYGVRAFNLTFAAPGFVSLIDADVRAKINPVTQGESGFVSAWNMAVDSLSKTDAFGKMSPAQQHTWMQSHKLSSVGSVPLLPVPYEVSDALTNRGGHVPEYKLRVIFNTQVQPWISGGLALAMNAADKADLAANPGNDPMAQGIWQWQLWRVAAQGRGVLGGSSAWYGSDTSGALKTLSGYISHVGNDSAERAGSWVAFDQAAWKFWPTFRTLYTGSTMDGTYIDLYLNAFINLDYDAVLRTAAALWLGSMVPQPATVPIKITVGTKQVLAKDACPGGADSARAQFAAMPVTYSDFHALDSADKKTRAAALKRIVDSPVLAAKSDGERTAIQAGQLVSKYFPALAAFTVLSKAGMKVLIDKFGAAAGFNPCDPPYTIISAVFARSLDVDQYRLVPDGSTGDVLVRMTTALLNYAKLCKLDLGLYAAGWTQTQAQAAAKASQAAQQRAMTTISTGGYAPPTAATTKVPAAPTPVTVKLRAPARQTILQS